VPSPVADEVLESCDHIVALMAWNLHPRVAGRSQIVLGGRTTDTAVLAAVPIMKGAVLPHPGTQRRSPSAAVSARLIRDWAECFSQWKVGLRYRAAEPRQSLLS